MQDPQNVLLGAKEVLSFLKKNNKSIIQAWESYKLQVGDTDNRQLNGVFEQMFKAWLLSNKKAIKLLEKAPKKTRKPAKSAKTSETNSRKIKPKNKKK